MALFPMNIGGGGTTPEYYDFTRTLTSNYSGNSTWSLNITSIPGYTKLTLDDIYIQVTKTITFCGPAEHNGATSEVAYPTSGYSYNASTGILTISWGQFLYGGNVSSRFITGVRLFIKLGI